MSKKNFAPKSLKDQVIVITGATNGIGLACAKLAANRGAKVVMSSRNQKRLNQCVQEIMADGGIAVGVTADASLSVDLELIKEAALSRFGEINTWVNNAVSSVQGYLHQTSLDEERALFDINFWGTRMGSSLAVEVMKIHGGVLINLGSEVSVAPPPLLGMYNASKQAIAAFTEVLRSELRDQNIPIEVCLIRPTAIETDPTLAAEAILKCAEHPQRDVFVGGPAKLSAIVDTFFPKLKDIYAESQMKHLKD